MQCFCLEGMIAERNNEEEFLYLLTLQRLTECNNSNPTAGYSVDQIQPSLLCSIHLSWAEAEGVQIAMQLLETGQKIVTAGDWDDEPLISCIFSLAMTRQVIVLELVYWKSLQIIIIILTITCRTHLVLTKTVQLFALRLCTENIYWVRSSFSSH